ncbi:MAG: glycoside hydrolase family 5 protein [Limisphaerales bacterium]
MKQLIFLAGLLATVVAGAAPEPQPGQVFFQLPPGAVGLTNADPGGSALKSFVLPVEQMRGTFVSVSANIKAQNVSAKPEPWNGLKLMVKIENPDRTDWPQPTIPVGTFDWQRFSNRFVIPANATAATLTLGLEKVSGTAWFDQVKVSLSRVVRAAPPAAADQPIFRGHDLPRLRGAMVSPGMSEADLAVLADQWHGNLIRWQLIHSNRDAQSGTASYDQWLDGLLAKTDQVLDWAKKHGVKVVLDLHSPPGGKASPGGYVAAMGGFFSQLESQRHFVEVWQKMARRYKGNAVIWGFDLVNEPVDDQTADGCQDWQALALTAGKAIRAIDPERILIVEPPRWGSPAGWNDFNPIPLPRVVYSFHMYEPGRFTHQRVFDKSQRSVSYPGEIDGQIWNRNQLIKVMQPAVDFARKYRVHLYVGEFSAIRWAPGAERYLADLTSIFEEQGWDWSYHAFREWSGWSLEHSADELDDKPVAQPTARFEVIDHWLKQNRRASGAQP